MDLFGYDPSANLLPCDGMVNYYGPIFDLTEAQRYLEALLSSTRWEHDEVVIFGKRIVTTRQVAWYGDSRYSYTYSGTTKQARVWTADLRDLKARVEKTSGETFNSCLLNLYRHGDEGMSWHSDDERTLARDAAIASVSFGAERKFAFKHKHTKQTVSLTLQEGSLLVMKDATQTHWLHSLPKTKTIKEPRINLTFRTILVE